MQLTLTTPKSSQTITVTSLELETLTGDLVIQDGHAPALAVLRPNSYLAWTLPTETVVRQKATRGIVEINRTYVRILFDNAKDL